MAAKRSVLERGNILYTFTKCIYSFSQILTENSAIFSFNYAQNEILENRDLLNKAETK